MFLNTFDSCRGVKCGLVAFIGTEGQEDKEKVCPISLESINIRATIIHAAAEVNLTQTFINSCNEEMETFYYFPLSAGDAVTSFEVNINGFLLKNIVLRDNGNKNEYEEAVRKNPQRFLIGPNDPEDFYQARVGLLQPNGRATVKISYVTEVPLLSQSIHFTIPNTVAPRFGSGDEDKELAVDSSISKNPENNTSPSVGIRVEIFIQGDGGILQLDSPTHDLDMATISHSRAKENWSTGTVEFSGNVSDLDHDFTIVITPADVLTPRLYLEENVEESVLMSTFSPLLIVSESTKCEVILLIDSFSKAERKVIETVQNTLKVLLRSLPSTCNFNILGIGSSPNNLLFPAPSVEFDDNCIQKATLVISDSEQMTKEGIDETSVLLEKAFTCEAIPDSSRQIILLIHKAIKDEQLENLVNLAKNMAKSHKRLFVIGLGRRLDIKSIQRLASAGGGVGVLIVDDDIHRDSTLLRLLELCFVPSLEDVRLNWREWAERVKPVAEKSPAVADVELELEIIAEISGEADRKPLVQIPELPPPIFNGTQFVNFGIFVRKYIPTILDIEGTSYPNPSESLQYNYNVQMNDKREQNIGSVDTITKLAFAKALKQLEDSMTKFAYESRKTRVDAENTKERIMQIACREGIPSKYTSFATINIETGDEVKGNWTRQTRYKNNVVGFHKNPQCGWNERVPYGSISRNKLNSIRKLSCGDVIKQKIPRTVTSGDVDLVVDLTDEQEGDDIPNPTHENSEELITILD